MGQVTTCNDHCSIFRLNRQIFTIWQLYNKFSPGKIVTKLQNNRNLIVGIAVLIHMQANERLGVHLVYLTTPQVQTFDPKQLLEERNALGRSQNFYHRHGKMLINQPGLVNIGHQATHLNQIRFARIAKYNGLVRHVTLQSVALQYIPFLVCKYTIVAFKHQNGAILQFFSQLFDACVAFREYVVKSRHVEHSYLDGFAVLLSECSCYMVSQCGGVFRMKGAIHCCKKPRG